MGTTTTDGGNAAEKRHYLTPEAHRLYTAKGEPLNRWRLDMYVPRFLLEAMHDLWCEVAKERGEPLPEPINDAELMKLVSDDGDLVRCSHPRCENRFRPVRELILHNAAVAGIRARIKSAILTGNISVGAPASDSYGRLAPFIVTDKNGTPLERGSLVKWPTRDSSRRQTGWQEMPFCGALYWWDQRTNMVFHNNNSHLVTAVRTASESAGREIHSFSRASLKASIASSEAKHRANIERGDERELGDKELRDLFGVVREISPSGERVFSKGPNPPPTVGSADPLPDRSAKRRSQGQR